MRSRTGDARAQLEAVVPLLPAMPRDSEWLPAMAQIAETIALTGPHPVDQIEPVPFQPPSPTP